MSNWPEYSIWKDMIKRCHNQRAARFKDWGGRGIIVCEEWRNNFSAFIAYVGRRPSSQYSIERIDNDGNYEPGNVKWATDAEQSRNTSRNHLITHDGKTLPLIEWSEVTGIKAHTISARLNRGWLVTAALTQKRHLSSRIGEQ